MSPFGLGVAVAFASLIPCSVAGQAVLDSLVASNSYTIVLRDGRLEGSGADLLLELAAESQFVALGEEHNTLEVPLLTTALFRTLHAHHGFDFLALEQDPMTMRSVSTSPLRGDVEAIAAHARRYPHGFTFIADQELAMLSDVGAISSAEVPVWGVDQAFGVAHVLDRLVEIDPRYREAVLPIAQAAHDKERVRDLATFHYLPSESHAAAFEELTRALAPSPGSEAHFLLQSLMISDQLYGHYREGRGYRNGYEREDYMKRRFRDEYRRVEAVSESLPRVLLKLGHWHLFRGLGPSNLQTLGNFVSEFARSNGSQSLHVAIFPHGEPGAYGDLSRWRDPVPASVGNNLSRSHWTIVDIRALRPHFRRIAEEAPAESESALRRWIFGYDLALFVGGMKRGTYELNPGVAF